MALWSLNYLQQEVHGDFPPQVFSNVLEIRAEIKQIPRSNATVTQRELSRLAGVSVTGALHPSPTKIKYVVTRTRLPQISTWPLTLCKLVK